MTGFDFDTVIDRHGTGSAKWSRYPAEVLPMWVADMDFASAPEIIAAIRRRLDHPLLGYSVARDELRQVIVADMAAKYGWAISAEDIVFLPGVEPGFNMALNGFLSAGDGLLINTPIYRPIFMASTHWQLRRVVVELLAGDGGYGFDATDFAAGLKQSKAFLFCNPHNPTGKVFTRAEVEAIAEQCLAHDTLIISDEIHCDLLFDGRVHTPIAALSPQVANRTITLMAASKTYNVAGLKTAFAIVQNKELRERFSASRRGMVDSVNIFGLEATLAALTQGQAWKDAAVAYLQGNRDFLAAQIASRFPGIRMLVPEGTFLAWLDCSALELAPDPHSFFLDTAKVGFSAGPEFGDTYGQYVRLNFGCPRALLVEGLNRMERALRQQLVG